MAGGGFRFPSLGPRYVFFSSLSETINNIARMNRPELTSFYSNALTIGQGFVDKVSNELTSINLNADNNDSLSKMQEYVNFFGDAAKNEQNNEIAFLNKVKSCLDKLKDSQLLDEIQEFLDQIQNGENVDYKKLIQLINSVMTRFNKDTDKINKIYQDNMEIFTNLINKLKKQDYDELESLYFSGQEKDLKEYNRRINALLRSYSPLDTLNGPKFETSYSNLLADRVNSVLVNLENMGFLQELVKKDFLSNSKGEIVSKKLIAYIYDYLSKLDLQKLKDTSGADLAQIISEDRHLAAKIDEISQEHANEVFAHFSKKSNKEQKSIEEIALTTGRNTGVMLRKLADPGAFIEEYREELGEMKEVLEKFAILNEKIALTERKSKERASKIINQAVKKRYAAELAKSTKETIREKIKDLKIDFPYRIQRQSIDKNLQVKTQGYDIAELLASDELRQAVIVALMNPGKTIKLKNDISYIIKFDGQIDFIKNKTAQRTIQAQIDRLPESFIQAYNKEAKGATDVSTASETYIQAYQDLLDQLKQMKAKRRITAAEYKKILEYLNNTIMGGISVKDYTYGTNQFGFHGGSLGSTPEKVLNNIYEMYKLGGISPIDTDLLLFAAMNCSAAALGSSLKQPLATYLLGGAAMMMFDDGFTASTHFLEKMKADLGVSIGGQLHLFRVQTKYIPASYVYMHIYNNLMVVINDINSNYEQINNGKYGGQVHINNNLSNDDIKKPPYLPNDEMRHIDARWKDIQEKALEININFTFLAGLLDIFNGIPEAFKI